MREWLVSEVRRLRNAVEVALRVHAAAEKDAERYGSLLDRIEEIARNERIGPTVARSRIVALFDEDDRRATDHEDEDADITY